MATYVTLYNFTDQGIAKSKSDIECRLPATYRG